MLETPEPAMLAQRTLGPRMPAPRMLAPQKLAQKMLVRWIRIDFPSVPLL
jgi:hypothetical protein